MGRLMGMILIQCFLTEAAWAIARPATGSPTAAFFAGKEIAETDEFETGPENAKLESLADRIVSTITERYGLSAMNMKAHGVRASEYLARMAKSDISVIYIDAANIRRPILDALRGHFTFDLIYARGSKFFIESSPLLIKDCQGRVTSDKRVEVNLERCIADHLASL